MRKIYLAGLILFSFLCLFWAGDARAVPVTFNFTGDNLVQGWYLVDGTATPILAAGDADGSYRNWRIADTQTIDLEPNQAYQIVWQIINDDNDAGYRDPGLTNPGGFLAQVLPNQFWPEGLVTGPSWEVAVLYGSTVTPDFGTLVWDSATPYGYNGAPNIWAQALGGGSVAGISSSAQWIWTDQNFDDPLAPGRYDSVFFRLTLDPAPVPEPASLLLLGSGLIGLAALGRRKFSK